MVGYTLPVVITLFIGMILFLLHLLRNDSWREVISFGLLYISVVGYMICTFFPYTTYSVREIRSNEVDFMDNCYFIGEAFSKGYISFGSIFVKIIICVLMGISINMFLRNVNLCKKIVAAFVVILVFFAVQLLRNYQYAYNVNPIFIDEKLIEVVVLGISVFVGHRILLRRQKEI